MQSELNEILLHQENVMYCVDHVLYVHRPPRPRPAVGPPEKPNRMNFI